MLIFFIYIGRVQHNPFELYPLLFVVLILAFAPLLLISRIACPRCKGPMGLITTRPATRRMMGKAIRCLRCGVDIDEPIESPAG